MKMEMFVCGKGRKCMIYECFFLDITAVTFVIFVEWEVPSNRTMNPNVKFALTTLWQLNSLTQRITMKCFNSLTVATKSFSRLNYGLLKYS